MSLLIWLLIGTAACKRGQPALTEADTAGEVFSAGAKVKAPLGKRKPRPATVVMTYGKLAKLHFNDSNTGWALLKELEPQGAVQHYPDGDSCSVSVGDHVQARWSTALTLTAATVDEVYGKMAHLTFADKDVDWAPCDELKPPADEPEHEEGGGGASAAVTKCKRGCNHQCQGASNKSKCVGQCRRACDG